MEQENESHTLSDLKTLRERLSELEKSEYRYRHIFEELNDAAFVGDVKTGILLESNKRGEELLGRSRNEIIGMHQSALHPPDMETKYRDKFKRHIEHGRAGDYDGEIIQKDGTIVPVRISASTFKLGDKDLILGLFRDISERKAMEDALLASKEFAESLIEAMREGILVLSHDGRPMSANKGLCEMTGYSRHELLDLTISPLILFEAPGLMDKMLSGNMPDTEISVSRKDKTSFPALLTPSYLRGESGEISCIIATLRDLTERKKLYIELARADKLDSLGLLAGGIAHDFNNLLTTIMSNVILSRTYIGAESKAYNRLAEAEQACLKAKDIASQLLTFSSGGTPVKKLISPGRLIRDAASFALSGSNSRAEFNIPDDLWAIEADERQIRQCIRNIVINASHAMPDNGVVSITARNLTPDAANANGQRSVAIAIRDSGKGISESTIKKIFDPFFTTKEHGSGLGLTCAYSIAKSHGGDILVNSIEGQGAEFTIRLPASDKAPANTQTFQWPIGPQRQWKLLLMDDDESIREVLSEFMRSMGCLLTTAEDGEKAIKEYKKAKESRTPFDAVILDLTVPGGMGGKEAIRKLLKYDNDIKAVVSSGYSYDPVMAEFDRHGFKGVITKPYKLSELWETLNSIIEKNTDSRPGATSKTPLP